jgi:hypothetical protein
MQVGVAPEMRMVIAVAIELPDREHVPAGVHPGSQDQSACALDCKELFRLAVFTLHGHTLASNLQIPQTRGKSTRSDPYKGDGVAGLGRPRQQSVIACAMSSRTPCFLSSFSDVLKLIRAISSPAARLYEATCSPSHPQPPK